MSDIQELENRIEQFKSMLSRMQYDLNTMESELRELKSAEEIKAVEPAQQNPVQSEPIAYPKTVQPEQVAQPKAVQSEQQVQYTHQQVQPQQVQNPYIPQQPAMQYNDTTQQQVPIQPVQAQPAKKASKLGTEALLGKSIMGIAASVLIFISLILFATLIIPNLTETLKLILMYGVSIIVTVVGLTQWIRKNSTFFLSIGACGVGSIYISLFLNSSFLISLNILSNSFISSIFSSFIISSNLFESISN